MIQVLVVLLLYPVFIVVRILLTAVFLFAQLILAGMAELGGEAAEKVLDSFFGDKVRGAHFPFLVGLVFGLLVGSVVFLFFVFRRDPDGLLDPLTLRLMISLTCAFVFGGFAGLIAWGEAQEYQERRRYAQEREERDQKIREAQREARSMFEWD